MDEPASGGSRILVIDDEEVIHVSLRRLLGRQGHSVETVLSAPEALKLLEEESFDLVITDLMMPEMNGIQLLERAKETGITAPFLMITGYPSIRTALHALRLGAVDYVAKPFTRQELLGPVNRTLRRTKTRLSGEPVEKERPASADGYDLPEVELKPGDRLSVPDHSWAVYQQDGTVQVGIEAAFLSSIGAIASMRAPEENDLVEQGFVGFRLMTVADEEHNVVMPLSGQVVGVNQDAISDPASIGPETWVIQLLPNRLEAELAVLLRS
jgi:CheY-like chemotaxis protein